MALSKEIKNKMKKYNELRRQTDRLQHEVEKYLTDEFGIYTLTASDTYGCDGNCPMYEWGTELFDIELIKAIIVFKDEYRKKVGEAPDNREISEHFAH